MKKVVQVGILENASIDFKIHHAGADETGDPVIMNIRDTFMPGDKLEGKKLKYPGCDFTLLEQAVTAFHTPAAILAYEQEQKKRP